MAENNTPVHVIGSGFGRTGTNSLKLALEILYGSRCYHMIELENEDKVPQRRFVTGKDNGDKYTHTHSEAWLSVAENGIESIDINRLLKDYCSVIDFPASAFYKDLMKVYPEAKVILTVRDDASRWYDSSFATIYSPQSNLIMRIVRFLTVTRERLHFKMVQKCFWHNPSIFDGKFHDREFALQVYHDWISECKQIVDGNRLLVFNVKEGWAPLCKFLGCPIPTNVDFPFSNNTQAFNEKMKVTVKKQAYGALSLCTSAALIMAICVCFHQIRRT